MLTPDSWRNWRVFTGELVSRSTSRRMSCYKKSEIMYPHTEHEHSQEYWVTSWRKLIAGMILGRNSCQDLANNNCWHKYIAIFKKNHFATTLTKNIHSKFSLGISAQILTKYCLHFKRIVKMEQFCQDRVKANRFFKGYRGAFIAQCGQ